MLTQAQQKQIATKVESCYVKCETYYNRTLPRPTIRYDLTGTTAGTANPYKHVLQFQPVLASENFQDFIDNTVPHEVAHLVDYDVNNKLEEEALQRSLMIERSMRLGRRVKRPKRDLHGDSWRAVMRVLGIMYAKRCHQYNTENVSRRKSRHQYNCSCGMTYNLGPKYHSNIQTGRKNYKCKRCGTRLLASMHGAVTPPKRPVYATAAQAPRAPKAPRMGTKLDHACTIVATHDFTDAGSYIALIQRDLGMSKAGATTYYYQAKKRIANG